MSTSAAPIVATYRIAGPTSWVRTLLAPLYRALASMFPAEARRQRTLSLLDREFVITAELPSGWQATFAFDGPQLVVALTPPEQSPILAGGGRVTAV